jgi:hypothetical protein
VIYESRFSVDELPAVREKAIDMMLASADLNAQLSINDELELGMFCHLLLSCQLSLLVYNLLHLTCILL